MATETMFARYGGFQVVSRVVSSFYQNVLESPILAHYFNGVEMRTQIDHQTKFVASLMGGPASFTNEHLQHVHARLHITSEAFEEMTKLFRYTLEDHDFDETDIGQLMHEINSRRPYIVTSA